MPNCHLQARLLTLLPMLWASQLGASTSPQAQLRLEVSESCSVFEATSAVARSAGPAQESLCDVLMGTNCSVEYPAAACPAECPFIVPHHVFACLYQCKRAERCVEADAGRAYADPGTRICMSCGVPDCEICTEPGRCGSCFPGFVRSHDGSSCLFEADASVPGGLVRAVVRSLAVLLCFLVLLAFLWPCMYGAHPRAKAHEHSILRARRHRRQAKVLRWDLAGRRDVARRYNLATNVHSENILGLGLALFYNSVAFAVFLSLLLACAMTASYRLSGADAVFRDPELGSLGPLALGKGAPAVVTSRLVTCPVLDLDDLEARLQAFSVGKFWALCLLYVALFAGLLRFARSQKRAAKAFRKHSPTMAEFALEVSGLPAEETDEGVLREFLEAEFRKVCPGLYERPERVTDGGKYLEDRRETVPDSAVQVQGVSICYDYSGREDEVDHMVQTLLTKLEVDASAEARRKGHGERHLTADHVGGEERLREEMEAHRETVRGWFEGAGGGSMPSSGRAFVVFTYAKDRDRVLRAYAEDLCFLRHPRRPEQPLRLREQRTEPPSINWWHMGAEDSDARRDVALAVLKILAAMAAAQVLVILPYARHFLWPYSQVGSSASGLTVSVLGFLVGLVNGLMRIQIWATADSLRFRRKSSRDALVLVMSVVSYCLNCVLNVVMTLLTASGKSSDSLRPGGLLGAVSYAAIGAENQAAEDIYSMMVPGVFFTGFLTTPIMAGIWPFAWNILLMKHIYVWRSHPRPLLRLLRQLLPYATEDLDSYPYWKAEKALEPMEVQIEDYTHLYIIPSVCCLSLFFMSPVTHQLFLAMVGWAVFFYCFLRYMHLRFCKAAYYTTNVVDNCMSFLWALPLSMVAAACAQWGIRSGRLAVGWPQSWQWCLLAVAFAASCLAWALAFYFLVDPWERRPRARARVLQREESSTEPDVVERLTVGEVAEHTCYSWFNCNPVYVLKCQYLADCASQGPSEPGGEDGRVRFYAVGKEYLFLKPERQHLAFLPGDPLEFETYLEALLAWLALAAETLGCWRRSTGRAAEPGDQDSSCSPPCGSG